MASRAIRYPQPRWLGYWAHHPDRARPASAFSIGRVTTPCSVSWGASRCCGLRRRSTERGARTTGKSAGAGDPERRLRRWVAVRHRDAAERTVLTAIAGGASPPALADLLFAAETDRAYADGGHSLDFINKAFECLDVIGWEHAADVLPSVVGQVAAARGAEERTAWRQPVDLIALCQRAGLELLHLFAANNNVRDWSDHVALSESLLGDDPTTIIDVLTAAARDGASPQTLVEHSLMRQRSGWRALALLTSIRIGRPPTTSLRRRTPSTRRSKRIGEAATNPVGAVRALLHGAMAFYLARYLNVPPASLPCESGDGLDDLPVAADEIRAALLGAFDRQQQIGAAARVVARHLTLGHPAGALIATLAQALLRKDARFHVYQMLEAGVRQFHEWGSWVQGRHILIAVARYLAAHFPTQRALLQTADIASRLMRESFIARRRR
jgi:hypothetical protein